MTTATPRPTSRGARSPMVCVEVAAADADIGVRCVHLMPFVSGPRCAGRTLCGGGFRAASGRLPDSFSDRSRRSGRVAPEADTCPVCAFESWDRSRSRSAAVQSPSAVASSARCWRCWSSTPTTSFLPSGSWTSCGANRHRRGRSSGCRSAITRLRQRIGGGWRDQLGARERCRRLHPPGAAGGARSLSIFERMLAEGRRQFEDG